jgi:sugar (pentulose or hexulose) kinase
MPIIGIDLGTSFIKGAVLDLKSRRIKFSHRLPFPAEVPCSNPLFCEFDPDSIVCAVQNLINDLMKREPRCTGIVMCTQMHGMVLMTGKKEIRSNCITWRDQRAIMPHPSGAGTYFDVMKRRITPGQLRELGNELRPGAPNSFLFWYAEQGKLEPGLIPVSMPDFVLSTLCSAPPSVEATNAMAYGLLNLVTSDWHHEVIAELGLSLLCWPILRKTGEVVGHLKSGSDLIPCFTPVGDYQCALLGALLDGDELSLNISTGSQVSRLTPELNLGDYQTRPFFGEQFMNTFTHIPAGRALDILLNLLLELAEGEQVTLQNPWGYIAKEAARIRGTDLRVDLNFFSNPFGERGAISNIREDNLKVGHIFRAAFNHMAENYHTCALRIWPDRSWKNLVFSGGLATRLDVIRQVIKEKFQSDYRLAPSAEDTLLGLMALGLVFTEMVPSIQDAVRDLRLSYPSEIVK